MSERPALDALADRLGVSAGYESISGSRRIVADASRVGVLAAMGVDASSEESAARALARLDREDADLLLAPARVVQSGSRPPTVSVRLETREPVVWHVELVDEKGTTTAAEGRSRARRTDHCDIRLPVHPGLGYHLVRVSLKTVAGDLKGEQRLIVVPPTCYTIREAVGARASFGILANLYSLRSSRNWGIGDLTDLATLTEWAAKIDAEFVGLNPLHALRNRGWGVSPYSPVSRLFRNILYLDPETMPEWAACGDDPTRVALGAPHSRIDRLRLASHVDYEAVLALKQPVFDSLYRVFIERHVRGRTERGQSYARYCSEQGRALEDFATFLALDAHFVREGRPTGWREWPERYRDPRSAAVRAFRDTNHDAIGLHCYLQFELDRQLGEAARRGREAGLTIGIYQDLAVGTDRDGSDAWAFPGLFADGANVGAPPDDYSAAGQDWGFPPVDPRRLARGGFEYWTRLLRAAFGHSGALRIDHAMGLTRLFWVPRGRGAAEGCYVRYPTRELLGILALESRRHRAFVIGEDLGTVPRGFSSVLARRGVLSSRVLYFERQPNGSFRPASRYSRRAIVTATTHDHAPLVGYRHARDLALRRAAGQIATDRDLERAKLERTRSLAALCERLRAAGLVAKAGDLTDEEFVVAVHSFLARTPAPLIGVYLDDLMLEAEPVNLPGVGPDRYSNWSRRLRVTLDELARDSAVTAALGDLRRPRAN